MAAHPIYRVRWLALVADYTLRVSFDDGSERTIDFEPILRGELFGPLRDPILFGQVRLDHEVCTLVWPNGADFDPATLHDWPQHVEQLIIRCQHWEATEVGTMK
jgi:hypothetical protein